MLVVVALAHVPRSWCGCAAQRRDLFWLSLVIGLYVPLQAIIGGITVLTNLNPYVVGLHYVASVVLVALSAVLVVRVYARARPARRAVPRWYAVTHARDQRCSSLVTVVFGILVTGSGPHAGDGGASRNGLDPEFMQHVHSWPAYALLALTLVLFVGVVAHCPRPCACGSGPGSCSRSRSCRSSSASARRAPVCRSLLVNIHMVLAVLLVAAMTAVVMHLTEPAGFTQAGPAYARISRVRTAPR